jgi:predicted amidohydrolase YtcJ
MTAETQPRMTLVFCELACEDRGRFCNCAMQPKDLEATWEAGAVRPSSGFTKVLAIVCTLCLAATHARAQQPVAAELILRGGVVIDGTGAERRLADVAIQGERIVAVGQFVPDPNARVVDASNLIIAPGFIDLHTHSDVAILAPQTRSNLNYLTQGVTTIVTGNCGSGALDTTAYLTKIDSQGAGTNVIHLIPHGALRHSVMGNAGRAATATELERMKALVAKNMDGGAWGMSTGLFYVPGRYADTAELIELSKVVAQHGGIYATHMRNEGERLLESIDEVLTIGREAKLPVHVSHLKASGQPSWGKVVPACEKIALARRSGQIITADQYPYVASSTQLGAMVVPHWARQGTAADFARIADDPEQGAKLRKEIEELIASRGPNSAATLWIARYEPKRSRVGHDLTMIARAEGITPLDVVIDIERHGGAQVVSFGMNEQDVRHVMVQEFVATASDGGAHAPGGGDRPHPRGYGTFPRKIRYALDEKLITLEQAIRANAGLPAQILRLPDRGVIRPGAFADIVVFDPASFRDLATFEDPTRYSEGVRYLFVNGQAAIAEGKFKNKLAGRALRLAKDGPADLILKVGRIWTGDVDRPWAQALAARAGALVEVGSAEDVAPFHGPNTQVFDRPGNFAIPGLIDAHAHLISLGALLDDVDLRGVDRLEEVARLVKVRIDATPGDSWIVGRLWDQSLWPGGAFPTAAVLDAVAPNRPVWLRRVDGHAGWANSEAMRRAKITADSKPPAGGQIIRDENGRSTGVFIDAAMELVSHAIPPLSPEVIRRRILGGQGLCLKAGLTGIHDASVAAREVEVYRALDREHLLKLRVYAMISPPDGGEVATVSQPPAAAQPGDRFVLRATKLFIDGAMGSRGGLLFEPYADDPGNSGLMLIDPKVLEATTVAALRNGWQVCTHAIGDRGNDLVLSAYAAAMRMVPEAKDPRLRIEHAQVVRKTDIARFKEWGIIASMQPSHSSDDMRWADARLGSGRVDGAYAWRWFLDGGVHLAFGSDFPVEIANPFWGIYAAITRQDEKGEPAGGWHPAQRMTLDETLRAYTAGSAYAAFDENRLGILKVGMRADVTVVDRDLFRVKPLDLLQAKVTATLVDGEIVFQPENP